MSDSVNRLNAALEGRYAIDRELGEGGMATVYLADDLKHERQVALKVLRPELAAVVGAERFLGEIKTTANLQHPHILPLFDSGEADGFLFYVMPYVEGETLRDRIDREKQLPVEHAVHIATAVANALDYAHRHNVIHRDIKPANILLQDGEPVVADFGIALAVGAAGGGRLTETGLSLGTPYYMSPEQATGDQEVGPSTDTYALGSVLYEMLVGDPSYVGSTAQAVLGKIIAGKPVVATEQRPSIPANVDAVIRRALEKLPADRFTSAQELARALKDAHFRYGEAVAPVGAEITAAGPWRTFALAMTAATLMSSLAFGWAMLRTESSSEAVTRSVIALPESDMLALADFAPARAGRPSLALSRDGTQLAYVVARDGVAQLFLRRLDEFEGRPLPGTEGAFDPFFSPEGQWIGFFTPTELKKISVRGGTPQTLSAATYAMGATWGDNGTILFAKAEGWRLSRVSAEGGDVTPVFEETSELLRWPQMLPDGRNLLATISSGDLSHIVVVSVETGDATLLVERGSGAQYVQSGHLVYAREGGIMAVPFDPLRLEVTGTGIPVLEGVRREAFGQVPQLAVSENGLLAYVAGVDMGITTPVWVDRAGEEESTGMRAARYGTFDLSPDGRSLAIQIIGTTSDVWIHDFAPGTEPRRMTAQGNNRYPLWAGGVGMLAFSSDILNPGRSLFVILLQSIDGGLPRRMMDRDFPLGVYAEAWSQNGALALSVVDPATGGDIWILHPDSLEPRPLITGPGEQWAGGFSPDGRWFAYFSDESGQNEVYVTDYPAGREENADLDQRRAGQGAYLVAQGG